MCILPPSLSPFLPDSQAFHTTEEEEEEDGEYNFLADSLRVEEREEFRNDRAVRIPRNEHTHGPNIYVYNLLTMSLHVHVCA